MSKRLYSVRACLQFQIYVWISDFIAWRAVSHDKKCGIVVGHIQEVVTVSSTRRECDASARRDCLAPRIGDEDEFAFNDVNEFILFRVGVPGRRLAAGLDTYKVHDIVFDPAVISQTTIPAFALAVPKWCRIPG